MLCSTEKKALIYKEKGLKLFSDQNLEWKHWKHLVTLKK